MITMSNEEEAIRQRMLQQGMQEQQLAAALKIITSQILEPKARERLSNLKYVKRDVATQLEMYLAQLYQSGQLKTKISDEQLAMILRKLTERKETKIRRK